MPFKSKAQSRLFRALEAQGKLPKGTASRWARHTPSMKKLPERKKTALQLLKQADDAAQGQGPPPGLRNAVGAVNTCGNCIRFTGNTCSKYKVAVGRTMTCDDWKPHTGSMRITIDQPDFKVPDFSAELSGSAKLGSISNDGHTSPGAPLRPLPGIAFNQSPAQQPSAGPAPASPSNGLSELGSNQNVIKNQVTPPAQPGQPVGQPAAQQPGSQPAPATAQPSPMSATDFASRAGDPTSLHTLLFQQTQQSLGQQQPVQPQAKVASNPFAQAAGLTKSADLFSLFGAKPPGNKPKPLQAAAPKPPAAPAAPAPTPTPAPAAAPKPAAPSGPLDWLRNTGIYNAQARTPSPQARPAAPAQAPAPAPVAQPRQQPATPPAQRPPTQSQQLQQQLGGRSALERLRLAGGYNSAGGGRFSGQLAWSQSDADRRRAEAVREGRPTGDEGWKSDSVVRPDVPLGPDGGVRADFLRPAPQPAPKFTDQDLEQLKADQRARRATTQQQPAQPMTTAFNTRNYAQAEARANRLIQQWEDRRNQGLVSDAQMTQFRDELQGRLAAMRSGGSQDDAARQIAVQRRSAQQQQQPPVAAAPSPYQRSTPAQAPAPAPEPQPAPVQQAFPNPMAPVAPPGQPLPAAEPPPPAFMPPAQDPEPAPAPPPSQAAPANPASYLGSEIAAGTAPESGSSDTPSAAPNMAGD